MLTATDLTLHYGSSQILHGVSLSALIGEVTCIMGSNGVGKTSLLKILSGTHPSSGGSYALDDRDVTGLRADQLAHAGVVIPAAGSSTSSNFGSCASSMPISSHCF